MFSWLMFSWFRKKKESPIQVTQKPIKRPDFETQRKAFIALSQKTVSDKLFQDLKPFFEGMTDYTDDEEFGTNLNYLVDYLERKDYNFIKGLNWKERTEELAIFVEDSLKNNYGQKIKLPNYDKSSSVAYDGVFESFDGVLRTMHLQLGFIDTKSDEYMLFIHQIVDREDIEALVNQLGYEYFERKF